MRIAALYDIHGNIEALEAVLREVSQSDADGVVVGGDVAWGPHPRETVDRLMDLEQSTTFIRGNADREVASRRPDEDDARTDITSWCSSQLTARQRQWLGTLPPTAALEIAGLGAVLFCHATPRSDEEIVTASTSEARVDEILRLVREPVVVCGHTHMQFDREIRGRRLINAGSVGLPYEGLSGAYWALLGPTVDLRRTGYGIGNAVERIRKSRCPNVEETFVDTILHPPSQEEAISHFEAQAG